MKPIQEYTKQEKLEAILEYNPCRTERNAVLRYFLAVRRDNAELIAYFESFGNSVSSHPSVWDEPISNYKTAVKQGIAELEQRYAYAMEHSSDGCNYNASKILRLMAKLKEIKLQYLEPRQLPLFDFA